MNRKQDRIASAGDYRRSLVRVYALLVFTFVVAGVVGWVTDSLTLFIRFEPAEAEGVTADWLASFCLLVAAYWGQLLVEEYTGRPIWRLAPWALAVIAIAGFYVVMRA